MSDTQDLLIEIGSEELPPKSLFQLAEAFHSGICGGLEKQDIGYRIATPYATPRRLAVLVRGVAAAQPDRIHERRGPALQAAYDKEGKPSQAAQGFARSCGIEVNALEKLETDKGAWLVYRMPQPGQRTVALLPAIVNDALAALPIPKRMRWSDLPHEFARPVHWIVLLFGEEVVETEIFGIKSGRFTRGHRFHHPDPIRLARPGDYAAALEKQGWVLPSLAQRKERIDVLVREQAEMRDGQAVIDNALLEEVASLVEWPRAITGRFSPDFLKVPPEALVAAMQGHQKYFPLVDDQNKLLPYFITISNIESRDEAQVRGGNERVIRPRLADAAFFWKQDCAATLESRWDRLKTVVFENRLGTVYDKSRRVAKLAGEIAKLLGGEELLGIRAGQLCKCDLLSAMVNEFPELQGIMGEYYARHDNEAEAVSIAIREHYLPRFWGDQLPQTPIGQAVALADRLDTLIGIFGIGQAPSGDKDPYGLRRAAIGALRIMIEQQLALDLPALLSSAEKAYPAGVLKSHPAEQVFDFILERVRGYYLEQSLANDTIDAVLACRPAQALDIDRRIRGVQAFRQMPAAASLAAANKRIHNILKKTEETIPAEADPTYFMYAAERGLYDQLAVVTKEAAPLVAQGNYPAALEKLATLREAVDNFFDNVMVMDENITVRQNRLALLQNLRRLFLGVADISRLQ
jgi:glycyl-tRNA synthetase beta chain